MSFNFEMNDPFAEFSAPAPPDGCTQCGICLSTCPTFIKSEDPEQSPMGRIRLMRALANDANDNIERDKTNKLESCLGCYTCETICPSKVDFGTMLDRSLSHIRQQHPTPMITRMMLFIATKKSLLKNLVKAAYITQLLGLRNFASKTGLVKLLGLKRVNNLLGRIKYPSELVNRINRPVYDQRVALFTGCFSSAMEQDIQQTTIETLNALGLEVLIPKSQTCCGALHRHNGDLVNSEKLARKNIKAFSNKSVNGIVSTSSGCGAGLKAYDKWIEDESFTTPVMDISHYLAHIFRQRKVKFNNMPLKVALHTPCTLRQNEDQEDAVLELLQKIPGLEIAPLSGEPRCCGAGGSQMLSQPEMADALRDDMIEEIKAMKVDMLISSNLGCAMHLKSGLENTGINIPLKHPVQLIDQAMIVQFSASGK